MNPEQLLRVTEARCYEEGNWKHNLACITSAQVMALGAGAESETALEQSNYREIMKNRLEIPVNLILP